MSPNQGTATEEEDLQVADTAGAIETHTIPEAEEIEAEGTSEIEDSLNFVCGTLPMCRISDRI